MDSIPERQRPDERGVFVWTKGFWFDQIVLVLKKFDPQTPLNTLLMPLI